MFLKGVLGPGLTSPFCLHFTFCLGCRLVDDAKTSQLMTLSVFFFLLVIFLPFFEPTQEKVSSPRSPPFTLRTVFHTSYSLAFWPFPSSIGLRSSVSPFPFSTPLGFHRFLRLVFTLAVFPPPFFVPVTPPPSVASAFLPGKFQPPFGLQSASWPGFFLNLPSFL